MATAFASGPLAVKHESALTGQEHTEVQNKLNKIHHDFDAQQQGNRKR